MKKSKIDFWAHKSAIILGNAVPVIIIILFFKMRNDDTEFAAKKCMVEKNLAFSGIVSKYQTDVFKEKSTFLLNDSISITIPRSSKELMLRDGDSICKTRNGNTYIIKRSWLNGGRIDTIAFDCRQD